LHPHELCLGYSSLYHSFSDCPHWGQFFNFSYGQLNTGFSGQGFESHYNSYTPNRDNHFDVPWYAHASGNYALQPNELHHPEYSQFNTHSSMPSLYNHPPQESLVQHFPTAHIDDLEEKANQLMAVRRAHTQPPHTHAPHQSCEYCYHPSHEFDDCPFYNHYVSEANKFAHKHAQTTTIPVSEPKAINKVEEKEKQFEPPPNPNRSNDKEMSTETRSFITILLKTQLEPQVSSFQCLKELSYVEIFKDSRTQDHKSRNCVPKRIFRSKLLGYIR
jgi:hypothetical protein